MSTFAKEYEFYLFTDTYHFKCHEIKIQLKAILFDNEPSFEEKKTQPNSRCVQLNWTARKNLQLENMLDIAWAVPAILSGADSMAMTPNIAMGP